MSEVTVSHHMLRRRARAEAARLNANVEKIAKAMPVDERVKYRVVKALRGPWRYRVVRVTVDV